MKGDRRAKTAKGVESTPTSERRAELEGTRVSILTDNYHEHGGLKWNIDQLSDQLVADGCSVTLVAFDGETREEYDDGSKAVVRTETPRLFPPSVSHLNWKVYSEMKRLESETDVFHVINTFASAGAGIYRLLGGETPVISTLNNWGLVCPSYRLEVGDPFSKHGPIERAICTFREADTPLEKLGSIPYSQYFVLERTLPGKRLDRSAAVSDYVKKVYTANGFPGDRIGVIQNHLDRGFLDAVAAHDSPVPTDDDGLELLYVGRLTENKGILHLLEAVERTDDAISLKVAGVGPLADEVEASAGTRRDVEYLGFVEREALPGRYFEADVFVHPATRPDPFPKTILESLHCDLPILCSNTGPVPEIAGAACVTFEAGSVDSLESEIAGLLENPDRLPELADHCANERAPYSFESVYANLTSLYSELLSTDES